MKSSQCEDGARVPSAKMFWADSWRSRVLKWQPLTINPAPGLCSCLFFSTTSSNGDSNGNSNNNNDGKDEDDKDNGGKDNNDSEDNDDGKDGE
jgi:hypothetical protein